ncbi:MAG TPA: SDR family oxidoreductase [Candidatus Binataceae bacterium]|jgi:NAD(P)-dependent dehydrogenase (short-subunit alcohol dehydrogenase family)
MEINGKVAVITGGASGIGRATAELLASGGAAVIIADLVETLGDETVKAIEAAGGRAAFVKADVTNEDDARRMLDTAVQKFGGLDILYNNAGIAVGVPGYPQAEIKRWRRVIEIDLFAVILGCHLAAPLMDPKGGAIINTASMAGLYPYKEDPVYGAAKAGVVNFTYSLAPWAAKRNIRVNCVCPGVVDTPLVRKGIEAAKRAGQTAGVPSTIMPPSAIANAVLSLIRDDKMFGRALEVRPSGPRLIETPAAPGTRR